MVCDKVVCVCDNLSVIKLCVTKLCVCDNLCVCDKVVCNKVVCDNVHVTKFCVTKLCVCDKVEEEDAEEEEEADTPGGCRSKNKNPTQCCGE